MTSRLRGSGAISRRRLLEIGTVVVVGSLASPSLVQARAPGPRELDFLNLHTGETLRTTYWADGAYLPDALADVNYLLRDFRTGDVKAIDVGLLDLLHDLRKHLESTEAYEVISGYRSPKTNSVLASQSNGVAKRSMHMKGLAIDVSLPRRSLSDLRQVAMEMRRGGVGFYPNFVHLDVGRVRSW
jgi:uncharacterized protein YcbK (DUF882 family)